MINSLTSSLVQSSLLATLMLATTVSQAASIPQQGTWATTLQARDVNHDGTVDAFYDASLGITWLADAHLDGGVPGFPAARPIVYYADASMAVGALEIFGTTAWRLPSVVNTPSPSGPFLPTGRCPASSLSGTPYGNCGYNSDPATSELAHMYYVTLGNVAPVGTNGLSNAGAGLVNAGPFADLRAVDYATNTLYDGAKPWTFSMASGFQQTQDPFSPGFNAWAVHDGDVFATPVPEPTILSLFALGMGVLGAQSQKIRKGIHRI